MLALGTMKPRRRCRPTRSCARSTPSDADLERRVEALKLLKSGMEPAKYASELEKLPTDLALKTQADQRRGGKEMKIALIGVALVGRDVGVASARSRRSRSGFGAQPPAAARTSRYQGNTPYDGRFMFVRLRYNIGLRRRRASATADRRGRTTIRDGEVHFTEDPRGDHATSTSATDGSNILSLDDPELFNYPSPTWRSRASGR